MSWRFTKRPDGAVIMIGEPPVREKFSDALVNSGGRVALGHDGVLVIRVDNAIVRYKLVARVGEWYLAELLSWQERTEVPTAVGWEWVDGSMRFGVHVHRTRCDCAELSKMSGDSGS